MLGEAPEGAPESAEEESGLLSRRQFEEFQRFTGDSWGENGRKFVFLDYERVVFFVEHGDITSTQIGSYFWVLPH